MEKSNTEKKLAVEVYFLRYAFPCAFVIKERGDISEYEYKDLENAAIEGFILSRPILERVFKTAFENIKALAKEMQKDKWDYEVIKKYFLEKHNELIDKGEGIYATAHDSIKQLSRVEKATIIGKKDDVLLVRLNGNGKTRNVLNHFVPKAKIGDRVMVHYNYAVEIV